MSDRPDTVLVERYVGALRCSWAERCAARLRMRAWRLLLLGIRHSGAAFIKWGQWSATREDLFPQARRPPLQCASLILICRLCWLH